jgi:peptidyl-prolyl cis-trans isomerase C
MLSAACGEQGGEPGARGGQSSGSANVGGQVISTVNGHPITLGEVQELVNGSQLSAEQALKRLQAERLLMIEAKRRGLGADSAVEQVARKAQVQSLLESITEPVGASDEQLSAAYAQAKSRFERAEQRVAMHVLAKLPKQPAPEAEAAAKAFAAQMIEPMAAASDAKAFIASIKPQPSAPFTVVAEMIPPVHRGSGLVRPFLDAMFELGRPGVVQQPVRTLYGWHAIRVLEIRPAVSTPYAAAAEQLRPEVVLEQKKQRVDELIAMLRERYRVERPADIRQILAKLEL